MQLIDILSLEKWVTLEKKIHLRSGHNTSVFNSAGLRITDFANWANNLCPVIKANEQGQSYICAVAHQNIANQSRERHSPVIETCDAGLSKFVVPIFIKEEFLGVVSGCGFLSDGNEIEMFMINKTTRIDEKELKKKAEGIPIMSGEQIVSHIEFIQEEVEKIIIPYEKSHSVL